MADDEILLAAAAPARTATIAPPRPRLRFDRWELAGAFADLGTSLPLLLGLVLAARLDPARVLLAFGLAEVATGVLYGMPMPVQPLKVMAAIVIARHLPAGALFAGGLAVGIAMVLLAASGALEVIARAVPRTAVRGIQIALGASLAWLALTKYIPALGGPGYALAAAGGLCILALGSARRVPPGLLVIAAGIAWAVLVPPPSPAGGRGAAAAAGLALARPAREELLTGLLTLALPQIALSLGNSILATADLGARLFPDRAPSVSKIGLTYGVMNVILPFAGGVPVCHGAGGLAGHHAFGARTGGSVVMIGLLYILVGALAGDRANAWIARFPLPLLGVLLFFEGLALLRLVRDLARDRSDLVIGLAVAATALAAPYGYLLGLFFGWALERRRRGPSTAGRTARSAGRTHP